jgi:hypothetical protein
MDERDNDAAGGSDEPPVPQQESPPAEDPPRRLPRIIELEPEEITRKDNRPEETRER